MNISHSVLGSKPCLLHLSSTQNPVLLNRGQRCTSIRKLISQEHSRLISCNSQAQTGPRFIQHKEEAKTFYRFLSIV